LGRVKVKPKLSDYRAKRRFDRTAEPAPKVSRSRSGRLFVIQKHDATRLHYDFRLEHDGVLKSWAIPKGPSLDPSERVLAVQVEDHPVDYGSFEGVIPEGEYGGGTVLLWDRGTWEPVTDAAEGLRTGKLKFKLHGKKLRGGWMLVRMHSRAGDEEGKNWLLIKERDQEAVPLTKGDVRQDDPLSVKSGRDIPEIAEARDRVWSSGRNRAGRSETSLPHGPGRGRTARASTSTAAARSRSAETKAAARRALPTAPRQSRKPRDLDPASLPGARKAPIPDEPMAQLATLVEKPPEGDNWLHEVKFDGYRILCKIHRGRAQLLSRRANDWTPRFKAVAASAQRLDVHSAILDGEVVVLTPDGKSDFQSLQNALKGVSPKARLLYFVFDLLYLNGNALTSVPLLERKELLENLLAGAGEASALRYSDHIQGRGHDVFDQACANGLEGIISKRSDSLYWPKRTKAWLKIKCANCQEFVIGGYTEPSGKREAFGALLLGYYDNRDLLFCGKVGTGFNEKTLASLLNEMRKHETDRAPFRNPPTGAEARGVHWLTPTLVGEVQFSEWTRDGTLRHPSFQGLREDTDARDVVREKPKPAPDSNPDVTKPSKGSRAPKKVAAATAHPAPATTKEAAPRIAGVTLSNPNRVFYPETGLTKLNLARYFESIQDWVLPHLIGRPLTLVRCPQGRAGGCFYQKHLTERMPAAVHGVLTQEKDGKEEEYLAIESLTGLIGLVQMGVLELHTWGCLENNVEKPDRLIIDLDPGPGVTWERIIEAARLVRERLKDAGLESFVKTTGGKGLHVMIPVQPRASWDQSKAFTKTIADQIVRDRPNEFTAIMTKSRRTNKIFIDYLRNGRGATAIAPYSTRARENAPVATPLTWEELSKVHPTDFTVLTIPERLNKLRRDPWQGITKVRQSLP
jgi:bifunctional non-homologous end joining protein LigD